MTGVVEWASSRARMIIALIALSLVAGTSSYLLLPKEGEPSIDVPILVVSLPFPGISAEDSEKLLVQPMETELSGLDGLKTMTATAAEGYANVVLEFEFGWDKDATIADVRDRMSKAEAGFPAGFEQYSLDEINFSELPIMLISVSGPVPERTALRYARKLQDRLESLEPILEARLTGHREEIVEVEIDPLRLEAYDVTVGELIDVVVSNNRLIAAGEVASDVGAFSVKIPSSIQRPQDAYSLPIKTQGDRVVTVDDLARIRLAFEDRESTARFNGETAIALQVSKRGGFNVIDTAALIRETVRDEVATWPPDLQRTIRVEATNDESWTVASMVSELESAVLTAVALVMIVVLASLGTRSALLVGFAIPTSFLLCFALLAALDVAISNIVMFGLILAVGMLVDGAIVVVEYADRRIREGSGPMHAYVEGAKRMFWPIVSSTATTLCAFLPMLFWPGIPGQFMRMLPITLIFVLSASLVVALIFLPVVGGVAGRMSRAFSRASDALRHRLPWAVRALLVPATLLVVFLGAFQTLFPAYLLGPAAADLAAAAPLPGAALFIAGAIAASIVLGAARPEPRPRPVRAGRRRTPYGRLIRAVVGNPVLPIVAILLVAAFVASTFVFYARNNLGVEFFVRTEPETAIVYVRARGNLSLEEKDAIVRQVEDIVIGTKGVGNAFSSAGAGSGGADAQGNTGPLDTIGEVQIELTLWEDRPRTHERIRLLGVLPFDVVRIDPEYQGHYVLDRLNERLAALPGIKAEILNLDRGPGSGKPLHLRLKGDDLDELTAAAEAARDKFESTPGLTAIEDTLPLPGIDWEIDVDVEKAGRYGANVALVGGMVQLVTRGFVLDTMRVDSSDEEVDIVARLPEADRVLSTLDTLKVRTNYGQVPLSNFVTREPVSKLGSISRVDRARHYDVKAAVRPNLFKLVGGPQGEEATLAVLRKLTDDEIAAGERGNFTVDGDPGEYRLVEERASVSGATRLVPIQPTERIETLTAWLDDALPPGIDYEWTGDQDEQEESAAFLAQALVAALGLMFIILLAQFNSFYNAVLVLLAVVLSTAGVLWGMVIMQHPFSVIITGTGIFALAGIVVNNNIVLIDTYQEYARYMPRTEAIARAAEVRIRPVLLTTITTMAGLTPMMLGLSLDFFNGGYTIDSPISLWWKPLATAVVFGLGISTLLILLFTPSMLAIRVWAGTYSTLLAGFAARLSAGPSSRRARDWALRRQARGIVSPEILWTDPPAPKPGPLPVEDRPAEGAPPDGQAAPPEGAAASAEAAEDDADVDMVEAGLRPVRAAE